MTNLRQENSRKRYYRRTTIPDGSNEKIRPIKEIQSTI
ncbi:hypothetical protein SynRS9902_02143 [Synechococcus sp. RS9902]|nr:hypothetical protein SynRS9902_02143 [Synechococcus sp. RS9902]